MKKLFFTGFMILLAVVVMMAGCGGGDDDPPCAHSWRGWTIITPPTTNCTQNATGAVHGNDGTAKRTCVLCGESETSAVCAGTMGLMITDGVVTDIGAAYDFEHICIGDFTQGSGAAIVSIGERAFFEKNIKSERIGRSVVSIGKRAFDECDKLTTVTFAGGMNGEGSQLQEIGEGAFCFTALKSITIPASVKTIGIGAFFKCEALTTVNFAAGSKLETISGWAFEDCAALTAIAIPAGVTEIGDYAFFECSSLKTVSFAAGSKLASIGEAAFNGCEALTGIAIPAGVTSIGAYAFNDCRALATVSFAAGSKLTAIGLQAFMNCSVLTGIAIPAGVTVIEDKTFENCGSLATVSFAAGSKLTTIGVNAFHGPSQLTGIALPAGLTTIGASAFQVNRAIKSITIPAGVTSIGANAFFDCSGLETVTMLPIAPPPLGSDVFHGAHSSLKIKVPSGRAGAYQAAWADWEDKIE